MLYNELTKNGWNKINFEWNPPTVMPLLSGIHILPTVDKISYQYLDLFTEFTALEFSFPVKAVHYTCMQ